LSAGKDLLYTGLSNLIRIFSGPLTVLFIPLYLNPEEQGYWFFFGSISALSILADFGFSNIVMQFTAHEKALLTGDFHFYETSSKQFGRIGSLYRFSAKMTLIASLVVFCGIFIVGAFVLKQDDALNYLFAWVIYGIGSFLSFNSATTLSFIEGMGHIAYVQKLRFFTGISNTSIILLLLYFNFGLYALSFATLSSSMFLILLLLFKYGKMLFDLINHSATNFINWKSQIFPLLGKYFISFFSGYFIFQLFIPIGKLMYGLEFCGRVGITISLFSAIFSMSNIWIYTVMPNLTELITLDKRNDAHNLFYSRLMKTLLTFFLAIFCLFVLEMLFSSTRVYYRIHSQLLSDPSIFMLAVIYLCQLLINSWATYVRAHRVERFQYVSICLAVFVPTSTLLLSNFLSEKYFFLGYFIAYIWALPWCFFIYKNFARNSEIIPDI
jgi:hypothetical protein